MPTTEKLSYWVRTQLDKTHYRYSCYECKKSSRFYKFPYCPFCGRRMVEDVVLNERGDVL